MPSQAVASQRPARASRSQPTANQPPNDIFNFLYRFRYEPQPDLQKIAAKVFQVEYVFGRYLNRPFSKVYGYKFYLVLSEICTELQELVNITESPRAQPPTPAKDSIQANEAQRSLIVKFAKGHAVKIDGSDLPDVEDPPVHSSDLPVVSGAVNLSIELHQRFIDYLSGLMPDARPGCELAPPFAAVSKSLMKTALEMQRFLDKRVSYKRPASKKGRITFLFTQQKIIIPYGEKEEFHFLVPERDTKGLAINIIHKLARQMVNDKMQKSGVCSICLEDLEKGQQVWILPCKHFFHNICIANWTLSHKTCPMCRVEIGKDLCAYCGGKSHGADDSDVGSDWVVVEGR